MDGLIPVINKLQEVFDAIDADGESVGFSSLDLPRIVVVGSQSSGKSSVLESLVQRDFLPRGKDIVTRRPLVLQLVHTSRGSGSNNSASTDEEWGEFGHNPGKKIRDFLAIRREIETETDRVAGSNKAISRQPIYLRIHSPRVVNLTLVDLPGITKIAVGDQPADIEQQLRALIIEYISRPNSLILAVTPANTDLVNSDALKLAQEVDPTGSRTIGVLTKLDLMDAGTHAAEILLNRAAFRLRLGFVGVVNRSQHDININKPINDALRQEIDFFRNHPHYRSISHRCGSQFLAKELNQILLHHIREQLPELRSRINALILATQSELGSLGDLGLPLIKGDPESTRAHRGSLLLKLVTLYVSDFQDAITGLGRINASKHPTNSLDSLPLLRGGARINQIFSEEYAGALRQMEERTITGLSPEEVRAAIRHSSGPRPALFVPEASFDLLARKLISTLSPPAHRCVDAVYEELVRLAQHTDRRELRRFPRLWTRLVAGTVTLLRERLEPTAEMVGSLLDMEMAYINTSHPDFYGPLQSISPLTRFILPGRENLSSTARDFSTASSPATTAIVPSSTVPYAYEGKEEGGIFSFLFKGEPRRPAPSTTTTPMPAGMATGGSTAISSLPFEEATGTRPVNNHNYSNHSHQPSSSPPTLTMEREEAETQLIQSLLHSYFGIVRKNLQDSVPKAIMHLLVNYAIENVGTRLVGELYREEMLEAGLLEEDEGVVRQRARCKTALEAYRQAAEILAELREPNEEI